MAGKPDAANIGSEKTYQNPQDAVEAEEGKYHDPAADLPLGDGLDQVMPRGPAPKPY
jgi:hypothetical protein